jgi:hypothetical protein
LTRAVALLWTILCFFFYPCPLPFIFSSFFFFFFYFSFFFSLSAICLLLLVPFLFKELQRQRGLLAGLKDRCGSFVVAVRCSGADVVASRPRGEQPRARGHTVDSTMWAQAGSMAGVWALHGEAGLMEAQRRM